MQLDKLIYKNFIWKGFFYLTSFILNIAIVRILGAELSGGLYFFLNNISFVLLIGSLSLESGIIYYVSKGGHAESTLASFSLIWSVLISGLISIFFLLSYNYDPNILRNDFLFFASFCFALGSFLNTYFNAFFYSHDNYKFPNLISGLINLILLIFIPWKQNWLGFIDTRIFLIIFFLATLMQGITICFFWFLSKKKKITLNISYKKDVAPVIKFSLTALIGNIAYFILYRIDYWFVEYYCSAKSLGNYIQVSRVGQLLILPCIILAGTLYPQSSKLIFSFEVKLFKKLILIIPAVYLLAGIFIFVFGRPIILFVWGKEFNEMYEALLLIMPGVGFLGISYLFSSIFGGHGKVSYNVWISLLSLVVVVICNFLLIPAWGINGAAIATTAGFTSMIILNFIVAVKKYNLSMRTLFRNS